MSVPVRLTAALLVACLAATGCTSARALRTAPVRLADLETRVGCANPGLQVGQSTLPVESGTCDFDGVPVVFATFVNDQDRERWITGTELYPALRAGSTDGVPSMHFAVGTGWALACADPDTVRKLALILGGIDRDE